MKKFKINWSNVMKALLFIISILVLLYMSFIFIVNGLSWFGVYLLLMSCGTAISLFVDFKEQIEKMSATRTSQHLKRYI